jgi:hypothetical protein
MRPQPRVYSVGGSDSTRVPQQLLVVQCDHQPTRPGRAGAYRLRQWAATWCRRREGRWGPVLTETGKELETFWHWLYRLARPRTRTWVIAFNAGVQLTLLDLWGQLMLGEISVTAPPAGPGQPAIAGDKGAGLWRGALVISDPPTIIAVMRRGASIYFCDTENWAPVGLVELCKAAGAELPAAPEVRWPDRRRLEWCAQVSASVHQVLRHWLSRWDNDALGVWGKTAGQCALASWRTKFAPRQLLYDRTKPHDALARAAYFGGHCRQWWRGPVVAKGAAGSVARRGRCEPTPPPPHGPISVFDVTSLYPWVMQSHYYPWRLDSLRNGYQVRDLWLKMRAFACVARVLLDSPTRPYPVKVHQETRWAVGRFWTALAGPELDVALESGHVQKIGQVASYSSDDLFGKYVGYWWARRVDAGIRTGNADELYCQIMLRSLWGKLGQKAGGWVPAPEVAPQQEWGTWFSHQAGQKKVTWFRAIAGHVQQRIDLGETRHSFPAIAATVTSAGRVHMEWLYDQVGFGRLLYGDTDSLHLTPQGVQALRKSRARFGDGLGELHLEQEGSVAHYHGLKDYEIDGRVTMAGLMGSAEAIGDRCWEQERWQTLSEQLAHDPLAKVRRLTETVARPAGKNPAKAPPDGWLHPPTLRDEVEPPPF